MPANVSSHRCPSAALTLVALLTAGGAHARSAGIAASGCEGCHSSTNEATVSLETNPPTFAPGSEVEVLARISGPAVVEGGIYIGTENVGELVALPGEGLAPVVSGLVHVQPKSGQGGQVEFRFAWKAPATPGAVRFYVYALGTNANGQRSGDSPAEGVFDRVYGCEGQEFYVDGDGDGFGRDNGFPLLACAGPAPPNYAAVGGDCIDYDASVYPGAPELCNKKDDDCDGEVDEDAEPIELWPDADGDGYYAKKEGEPVIGCVGLPNYAGFPGDCDDGDADIHPGAEEICDYRDNDCDGDADERVRPVCGEGWCRRSSTTCEPDDCYPGEPEPERCNYLDDDCDGEIDEGDLCGPGQHCLAGECVFTDSLVASGGSSTGGGVSGAAAAGGSATSGSGQAAKSSGKSGCAISGLRAPARAHWIVAALAAGGLGWRKLRAGRSRKTRSTDVGA